MSLGIHSEVDCDSDDEFNRRILKLREGAKSQSPLDDFENI
jgi:hypothetical protein